MCKNDSSQTASSAESADMPFSPKEFERKQELYRQAHAEDRLEEMQDKEKALTHVEIILNAPHRP